MIHVLAERWLKVTSGNLDDFNTAHYGAIRMQNERRRELGQSLQIETSNWVVELANGNPAIVVPYEDGSLHGVEIVDHTVIRSVVLP